jgi:hypothetical protein
MFIAYRMKVKKVCLILFQIHWKHYTNSNKNDTMISEIEHNTTKLRGVLPCKTKQKRSTSYG